MTTHLALQRILLPTAQVSSLTTGSITLPGARGVFTPPTAYNSISSTTLSGSTARMDFTSITQSYSHIQMRILVRGNALYDCYIDFNGDTGNPNYWWTWNRAYIGGTKSYYTASPANGIWVGKTSDVTSFRGPIIIDIYDYSSTTKKKSIIARTSCFQNGADTGNESVAQVGGSWNNTSAITSIGFYSPSGNLLAGTKVSLYGIAS